MKIKVFTTDILLSQARKIEEERHRMTLEALSDVDAGHVIDHPLVQAWADSLKAKKASQCRVDTRDGG